MDAPTRALAVGSVASLLLLVASTLAAPYSHQSQLVSRLRNLHHRSGRTSENLPLPLLDSSNLPEISEKRAERNLTDTLDRLGICPNCLARTIAALQRGSSSSSPSASASSLGSSRSSIGSLHMAGAATPSAVAGSVSSSSSASISELLSQEVSSSRLSLPPALSEEEERKLKIEVIKAQILAKMQLKEKPTVTIRREEIPKVISRALVPGIMPVAPTTPPAPTPTRATILLSDQKVPCKGHHRDASACFLFTLDTSRTDDVKAATLWVWVLLDENEAEEEEEEEEEEGTRRRRRTHSVSISQVVETPRHHRTGHRKIHVARKVNLTRPGWVEVDVRRAVSGWIEAGLTHVELEVTCSTCRSGSESPVSLLADHRPFLVITSQHGKVRNKRSTRECSTSSDGGCCRESMSVSAEELQWDDWLIEPRNFTFYHCRGTCRPSIAAAASGSTSFYSATLQHLMMKLPMSNPLRDSLAPCCAPTKYTPISLLFQHHNTVKLEQYDDLIVESCGCNA